MKIVRLQGVVFQPIRLAVILLKIASHGKSSAIKPWGRRGYSLIFRIG
jgi:hypothetical protein